MKTADGRLYVIGGASRSGKTAWTKRAVEKERRLFAWDVEDQWSALPGWRRVTTRGELAALAQQPGAMKIAYVAAGNLGEEFDFFCACVWYATRYVEPTSCIAEELADVTTPSKAPGKWGILLRRGLKRGGNIYAISQRWQEADKTAMGNAGVFVFFRQNGPKAAQYLANATGIDAALIPREPLRFVTLDAGTGKTRLDVLRF